MLHSLRKTTHRDKSRNKKYVLAKLPPSLPNEVTVVVSKKTRAHTHKHALCTMRILLRMHVVFAHTWSQFCFTLVKTMLNTFHSWLKRDLRLVPSGPKGKVDRGLKLSEGHRERATAKRVWHLLEREHDTFHSVNSWREPSRDRTHLCEWMLTVFRGDRLRRDKTADGDAADSQRCSVCWQDLFPLRLCFG